MDIKPFMAKFGFGHRASKHIIVEQEGKLWLAFASEGAGMFMMSTGSEASGLLEIDTLIDGKTIPYTYTATPSLVELTTEKGKVRIAIDAHADALRIESDGISLRFDSKVAPSGVTTQNMAKGAKISMGGGHFFFAARTGSISFDDSWLRDKFHSVQPIVDVAPAKGKIDLVVYDLPADTEPPEIVKALDSCAKENEEDFSQFVGTLAATPKKWDELREKIAYLLWLSHRKKPGGAEVVLENKLKSPDIEPYLLTLASMAFTDVSKAAELIAAYPAKAGLPIQGFAVLRLFEKGMFKNVSRSTVYKLYDLLRAQVAWWSTHRRVDGLYFYAYRHEAQTDTSMLFKSGSPVASPDINAYMAITCKALSKLSEHVLNRPDAAKWNERAETEADKFVAKSGLLGMNIYTYEHCQADKLISVIPLILGGLLPPEISAKLAAKVEDDVLSDPLGMLAVLGLCACGHKDAAERIVNAELNKAQDAADCPIDGAILLALAHDVLI
ncbi:MAG: hypothetical protein FWB97_09790 [Oscillospiraceae bacterium]|nr:hypothetical protein [Oscillospiraceae bacterium]